MIALGGDFDGRARMPDAEPTSTVARSAGLRTPDVSLASATRETSASDLVLPPDDGLLLLGGGSDNTPHIGGGAATAKARLNSTQMTEGGTAASIGVGYGKQSGAAHEMLQPGDVSVLATSQSSTVAAPAARAIPSVVAAPPPAHDAYLQDLLLSYASRPTPPPPSSARGASTTAVNPVSGQRATLYALDEDGADSALPLSGTCDAEDDAFFFDSAPKPTAPPNPSIRANPLMMAEAAPPSKQLDDVFDFMSL